MPPEGVRRSGGEGGQNLSSGKSVAAQSIKAACNASMRPQHRLRKWPGLHPAGRLTPDSRDHGVSVASTDEYLCRVRPYPSNRRDRGARTSALMALLHCGQSQWCLNRLAPRPLSTHSGAAIPPKESAQGTCRSGSAAADAPFAPGHPLFLAAARRQGQVSYACRKSKVGYS